MCAGKNNNIKKLVYVCYPYSADTKEGIDKNIMVANGFAEKLYKRGFIPVVPHNQFPFIKYEDTKEARKGALEADLALLKKCDILAMCSRNQSPGMMEEICFATDNDIDVVHIHGLLHDEEEPGMQ